MGNKAIFIEDKGGKRWQGRITRVDYLTFIQASARGSTPTGSKAFFTLFSIRIPFFILSHHSTPLSLLTISLSIISVTNCVRLFPGFPLLPYKGFSQVFVPVLIISYVFFSMFCIQLCVPAFYLDCLVFSSPKNLRAQTSQGFFLFVLFSTLFGWYSRPLFLYLSFFAVLLYFFFTFVGGHSTHFLQVIGLPQHNFAICISICISFPLCTLLLSMCLIQRREGYDARYNCSLNTSLIFLS